MSDSATPWAVACQAPLSLGFPSQETWSGLPSPQGIFPTQGSNPGLLHCRQILYSLSHQGSPILCMSEVAQSCPTLCDPMDYSPPGSSIHRIFQGRVLEGVVISFSRGSSRPRDWTQVSRIAGRHFTVWATREVPCYSQLSTIGRQKKAVSESRDAKAEVKRVKKRRWYYRFLNRLPFPWLSAMGRLGWFQVLYLIFLLI